MPRSLLLFVFAVSLLCARDVYAQATAVPTPVPQEQAPSTPMPQSFQASATHAVPPMDAQNGMQRVQAMMIQRYQWNAWRDAPPLIRTFLAERDAATANTIKPDDYMTYFAVEDIDGDKTSDLIVRFGSGDTCATNDKGCAYALYLADKSKARVVFHARKMVPAKGGVLLHNNFYALTPEGGETFDALSYRVFKVDKPFDPIVIALDPFLKKLFPNFYYGADRPPGFRYTLYDLNKDGKDELLVTIMEDDEEWDMFCAENDEQSCPTLIYTTGPNNAPDKLIGFIRSHQDLVIARKAGAPGYADIITTVTDENKSPRTAVFSMNAQTGQYGRD